MKNNGIRIGIGTLLLAGIFLVGIFIGKNIDQEQIENDMCEDCQGSYQEGYNAGLSEIGKTDTEEEVIKDEEGVLGSSDEIINSFLVIDKDLSWGWKEMSQELRIILDALDNDAITDDDRSAFTEYGNKLDNTELGDAIDGWNFKILYTKWCLGNAVAYSIEPSIIKDCTTLEDYPDSVNWEKRTTDVSGYMEPFPYFFLGWYWDKQGDKEKSHYYYRQVVAHSEQAYQSWGKEYYQEVVGDRYIELIAVAQDNLK